MPFQRGKSGNPGGQNKEKIFGDAVRVVVNRDAEDGRKKLMLLAEKLYDFAIAGEGWAMQQIADRLDGKPAQESTVTIDDKRDATDWTRDELVAFLSERRASRKGATEEAGRSGQPDRVH